MLVSAVKAAAEAPTIGTTIGLGLGTVFVGLLCLILIISLMSLVFRLVRAKKQPQTETAAPAVSTATPAAVMPAADRQRLIAAVSCAVATVMGKDVAGIRIISCKKVN